MRSPLFCRVISALLAAALLTLPGCETTPTTDQDESPGDVTLRDIRSEVTPPDAAIADLPADAGAIPADAAARARVTTVVVPLDRSVNAAWAVADETVFPALTRGVWHGNGLRVGLLRKADLPDFLDALPGTRGDDRQQRIVGGPTPLPLRRSRPLAANFFADLTVPPFAPKRETVRGHRLQLLVSFRPQPGGFTRVELTPHHHKPRHMLRPRTAQEKLMDGRVFDELAVTVAVPRDRYLVLGLARDPATLPPEPAAPVNPQENKDADNPPAETALRRSTSHEPVLVLQNTNDPTEPQAPETNDESNAPDSIEPPTDVPNLFPRAIQPLPLNLGRALMTEAVPGGEAQVILLLDIEPLQ